MIMNIINRYSTYRFKDRMGPTSLSQKILPFHCYRLSTWLLGCDWDNLFSTKPYRARFGDELFSFDDSDNS